MTSFSPSYQVHIKSPLVVNGVCVRWKGYFDMERLDGVACMEFDEEAAKIEDVILREQVEAYNRRMKEFEEYRKAQQRHIAAFMGQQHALQQAAAAAAAAQHQVSSTPTAAEASSTSIMAPSADPSSKSNGQIHSAADLVDIEEVSPVKHEAPLRHRVGRSNYGFKEDLLTKLESMAQSSVIQNFHPLPATLPL